MSHPANSDKPTMNYRFKNIAGMRFGRWTAIELVSLNDRGYAMWLCQCDCGNSRPVSREHLNSGKSTSCGCYNRERSVEVNRNRERTHISELAEYETWTGMIKRCHNPRSTGYENYGGRGIIVCERWRNSLNAFIEDMGSRPSAAHSIDRIDNDGNYEPGNCRWATALLQARNKRGNRLVTLNGKTQCLAEWAEQAGIPYGTLFTRIYRLRWPIEKALTQPRRIA